MTGMTVCPQPDAAQAGLAVLRGGGNAVDAAVATALVQGVVGPLMCGIGGCGVMLVHLAEARGRHAEVIEFYARAGSGIRPDQQQHRYMHEAADRYGQVVEGRVNECGYQSVAVPGTMAGLAEALRRHGTMTPSLVQTRRDSSVHAMRRSRRTTSGQQLVVTEQ